MLTILCSVRTAQRWTLLLLSSFALMFAPLSAQAINCQGGTTTVCGEAIPLPESLASGDSATVHVPSSVLGGSYAANADLTFKVSCDTDYEGRATYRVIDADKISCNSFPCKTSSVRLCDTNVSVPGGTPLGGVVHLTMPPPFARNNFTVQCMGNGDNPPVYQVTDHAAVSCGANSTPAAQ